MGLGSRDYRNTLDPHHTRSLKQVANTWCDTTVILSYDKSVGCVVLWGRSSLYFSYGGALWIPGEWFIQDIPDRLAN